MEEKRTFKKFKYKRHVLVKYEILIWYEFSLFLQKMYEKRFIPLANSFHVVNVNLPHKPPVWEMFGRFISVRGLKGLKDKRLITLKNGKGIFEKKISVAPNSPGEVYYDRLMKDNELSNYYDPRLKFNRTFKTLEDYNLSTVDLKYHSGVKEI